MAKVYKNQGEFLIIQMNAHEATEINFGIPVTALNNICLCGSCNTECKANDIYYIAGINEIMCKDCVEDFVENMNHYVDDDSLKYESTHFNLTAEKLNMKERASLTPQGKLYIYNIDNIDKEKFSYT